MEEENKRNERLQALKRFFEKDTKIKESLMRMAPLPEDEYSVDTRMAYADRLDLELNDLNFEFRQAINGVGLASYVERDLSDWFKKKRGELAVGQYSPGICQKMYENNFTRMDPRFVEKVKKECVGYTIGGDDKLADLVRQSQSVNELLHATHSYVTNSREILGAVPKIAEKANKTGYKITMYGEENEVARRIFEEFPLDLDVGATTILSLDEKVLMMIRDRGHALTMDIDTSKEDGIDIRYFVPKICNLRMVEALPGINKSGISENGATGFFVTSREDVTRDLFGFIEKVPTDEDIIHDEPIMYRQVVQPVYSDRGAKPPVQHYRNEGLQEVRQTQVFGAQDAKNLARETGKNGRKMGLIKRLGEAIKGKNRDFTNDKGGNVDEKY